MGEREKEREGRKERSKEGRREGGRETERERERDTVLTLNPSSVTLSRLLTSLNSSFIFKKRK